MIEALLTLPVTIQRRDLLRRVVSETTTTCYLEPRSEVLPEGEEPWVVAEETYRRTWRLLLPPETAVGAADTVTIGPEQYDVVDTYTLTNARTGRAHHIEATATRTLPPDALLTILRPSLTADGYDDGEDAQEVATDVRAWLRPITGMERGEEPGQEVVLFQLRADPADLRHYDRVRDQATRETYEVVWARLVGSSAGRAHLEGEVRMVRGEAR